MDPVVAAIIALVPLAIQVEGGIEQLLNFVATSSPAMTAEQIQAVRDNRAIADALYDSALAAAKKRLGVA